MPFQGYPEIAPLPEGISRPFWSVMIPTYNCANYLRLTLESVLIQDPGLDQMQIEVVDDYSTNDDPEAIVRKLSKDRVLFYRQSRNAGAVENFNTCIRRSRGEVVHILHGDDTVLPGFYEKIQSLFKQYPQIGAAFCRHLYVDEGGVSLNQSPIERETAGILDGWIDRIATSQRIEFPAMVVRRDVYEQLGGFLHQLIHAADWEMWRRIAVYYPVAFEPQSLANYRMHSASDSSRLIQTGANIADIRRSIEFARSYLPGDRAAALSRQANQHYAYQALATARKMSSNGNHRAAISQIREAFKCSFTLDTVSVLFQQFIFERSFELWINEAFDRHQQGNTRIARRLLFSGLVRNPFLVTNLGVLSLCLELTLGCRIATALRRLRHKIAEQQN